MACAPATKPPECCVETELAAYNRHRPRKRRESIFTANRPRTPATRQSFNMRPANVVIMSGEVNSAQPLWGFSGYVFCDGWLQANLFDRLANEVFWALQRNPDQAGSAQSDQGCGQPGYDIFKHPLGE